MEKGTLADILIVEDYAPLAKGLVDVARNTGVTGKIYVADRLEAALDILSGQQAMGMVLVEANLKKPGAYRSTHPPAVGLMAAHAICSAYPCIPVVGMGMEPLRKEWKPYAAYGFVLYTDIVSAEGLRAAIETYARKAPQ